MLSKESLLKKVWKFITTRFSLFVVTFLVVLSAIVLAGYTTVLDGETKPTASWTIEVSRGQKVHAFVDGRTTNWWTGLITPWSLVVKWVLGVFDATADFIIKESASFKARMYVAGNTIITDNLFIGNKRTSSKVFIYGWLQLSTINTLDAWRNCSNASEVGTIRLRLPTVVGTETYCPLQICYPGTQTWHGSGITRKSACDPVSFPTPPPIRTGVWIGSNIYPID